MIRAATPNMAPNFPGSKFFKKGSGGGQDPIPLSSGHDEPENRAASQNGLRLNPTYHNNRLQFSQAPRVYNRESHELPPGAYPALQSRYDDENRRYSYSRSPPRHRSPIRHGDTGYQRSSRPHRKLVWKYYVPIDDRRSYSRSPPRDRPTRQGYIAYDMKPKLPIQRSKISHLRPRRDREEVPVALDVFGPNQNRTHPMHWPPE